MASASKQNFLVLSDWRGGMNNTDSPHLLADDQVVLAENVEFWKAALGERRLGMTALDLTSSTLNTVNGIVHLNAFQPKSTEIVDSELWAVAATVGGSAIIAHRAAAVWAPVTPKDNFTTTSPEIYRINSQSIHGKFFIAYKSAVDRMHVWDGSVLRRTGVAQPSAAPTAADSGGAGTFTDTRIYRVRFIEKSGAVILRRSEPSAELTFVPSGVNASVTVTRPAVVNEGETHWELEASTGDGNFYVIATTVIGTTTAVDSNLSTAYQDFPLSEDIGSYVNIESVKFVVADQDRLIFGGSWTDPTHGSRISWTPVWADQGVGNDERVPTTTNNFVDLDWMEGGELTGVSQPINGAFYAFKHARIYKLQRTGNIDQAYESFLLSATRGAVLGSVVNGVDQYGRGCVYFLDPQAGPCRIGSSGLEFMYNLRQTWVTVNTNAARIVCHGIYYPDKSQVHWWLSINSADSPNYKIISQINEVGTDASHGGTIGGWSVATGAIANAYCSAVIPEASLDSVTGATNISFRPYAGFLSPNFIQRCDVGSDDNGTAYRAILRSKPYILAGLINWWGTMAAALLATAQTDSTVQLQVKFIRDFGVENSQTLTFNFTPEASESLVIKQFDNLFMSHAHVIQVEFSDP